MIWCIKDAYGADCEDFEKDCASCQAKKVVDWIEESIKLI